MDRFLYLKRLNQMQKLTSKLLVVASIFAVGLSCLQVAKAGDPFFRSRAVVLGHGHCVTPVQSFHQPVFNYSSPVVVKSHVVDSHVVSSHVAHPVHHVDKTDDVTAALKVITDFKLKQQALDQGLNALGYTPSQAAQQYAQPQYAQPQQVYGGNINYGLAPYAQGATQYQVESLQLSSFTDNVDGVKEHINSLMRLAENMQKNSLTVGTSVQSTVQTLADSASKQAESQVEVARITSEAAARVAMIQAAAQLVSESKLNSKIDLNIERSSGGQTGEGTVGEPIVVESVEQEVQTQEMPQAAIPAGLDQMTAVKLVTESCGACHMGGKTKGNFSMLEGQMSQADIDTSIAEVFTGEMPKQAKLTTAERLQMAEAIKLFGAAK
jgi:mono/diheme cytochrome c family protein